MFQPRIFHALCCSLALVASASSQSSGSPTATSPEEPCAQVSSLSAQFVSASPSAAFFVVPPDVAFACQQSVPLVEEDALSLLTGIKAWWEWQSTQAWLKNPPSDYPFPPVDLLGKVDALIADVQSGKITKEMDWQTQLVDIISSCRDGHLAFQPDAYSAFQYENLLVGLVSVSLDGKELPHIYSFQDIGQSQTGNFQPSPITQINGSDVVAYLSHKAFNETITLQDLDAMYNHLFVNPINANSAAFNGPPLSRFNGSSIVLGFKNGSEATFPLTAISLNDFTGVVDGKSFYQAFCNVTQLAMQQAATTSTTLDSTATTTQTSQTATAAAAARVRSSYPSAVVVSDDGLLAGYFLKDIPEVAILSITQMSDDAPSSQQTLTQFLDECRKSNKTHLIVDLSLNPGGSVAVSYDIFKQLFPTIEPFYSTNFRAHPPNEILGSYFTDLGQQVRKDSPDDIDTLESEGGDSIFDAASYLNDSGQAFGSWDELYGPVPTNGDNFTDHIQQKLADPIEDEVSGGIVVSGYGNHSNLAPQPFAPENMVTFGDGICASSCTILMHLLKYQGKVKSIVAGGRPQTGPMQAMGGVKGGRVQDLDNLLGFVQYYYANATSAELEAANKTSLKPLLDNSDALQLRNAGSDSPSVNLQNALSQDGSAAAGTPLQFVYEAADCRLWFQPAHVLDIAAQWHTVAEQAFGLNGQQQYSLCVAGSTNHPSSLSGNRSLFGGGQIANVTGFDPQDSGAPGNNSSASSSSSSAKANSAPVTTSITIGAATMALGAMALSVAFELSLGTSSQ